jgi:sugar lactone lactonase YvrE
VDIIYAYDYVDGEITNRRVFARGQDHGLLPNTFPDGLAIDSEGGIWTARWQGGRVSRYNPQGQIDFEIELPTAIVPTSCCFGGMFRLFTCCPKGSFIGVERARE